jgi:hypothetical protein
MPAIENQRHQVQEASLEVIAPGTRDGGANRLLLAIEATHGAVTDQLAIVTHESGYRAIARLSGHLAAMRRGVYTPLRRRPDRARDLVGTCCTEGRRLEWALRLLQCQLSGDMFAMKLGTEVVDAQLSRQLDTYTTAERVLAAWIDEHMPADDRRRLVGRYLRCLACAPTRPHPRGPHTGLGHVIAFGFHSFWDRVLDTTDSRPGVGRGFPVTLA